MNFRASLISLAMGFCLSTLAATANGQEKSKDKKELPKPETFELTTQDGLKLKGTYYASLEGKKAVPVLIVHDFKGNRNEHEALALYLQKLGHAVVVPDLRGHGDSTRLVTHGGKETDLEASRMRPNDFNRIFGHGGDLETVKGFLMRKNNAGELNIDKLCVIGVGMGSVLAANWAAVDWSWPPLVSGKQGQDVKALVLVSPEQNMNGMKINQAMNHPGVRKEISMLFIVGSGNAKSMSEANRIYKPLERYHPEPPPEDAADKKDLFLHAVATNLQGAKLLAQREFNLPASIAQFIDLRLVKKDFPWQDRSMP